MSPDALRIATANMDGVVRVYDVERGEPVITQRQAFVACRVVAYSGGQGFNLASGSDDGWVKFWAADSGELKGQLDAHVAAVEEGKPRKQHAVLDIACVCHIHIPYTYRAHIYIQVLDIAYHPSNTRLATSSDDRTVKFWARRFAAGAAAALAVGGGQTEAAMPDEDELVNAKRRRLTEARRRERLEELDAEQRLARQRRKEKALKRRIAEKQHAADAGADVEEFSSDDSDDSLLTEEDLMHIEKCVVEDEDNEVEVQFLAADPQKWVLACTLTGHKAAVTCVAFTASGDRCFSGSEDGTIRGWTAHIDAADEAAEVDLEELPEELRAGAARRRAERAGRREAGFGAQCVGPCANTCLVLIDVRGGMVRQLSVTCDDAMLFAASEGLGGWGDASAGGLVTVWDLRGYHRAGTFETFHPAVSIACAGEAPYMVTAGDRDGYVYLFRYGCQQPRVPRDARQVPPPNRPTGLCTIL